MRLPLLAGLLALAAASAGAQIVEHVELKGAHALIRVPEDWRSHCQ